MVSQRELQEVVSQINVILDRVDKRLQHVEATQNSLLHDLKDEMKKTARAKKNG